MLKTATVLVPNDEGCVTRVLCQGMHVENTRRL